jgi:hypothetical protein
VRDGAPLFSSQSKSELDGFKVKVSQDFVNLVFAEADDLLVKQVGTFIAAFHPSGVQGSSSAPKSHLRHFSVSLKHHSCTVPHRSHFSDRFDHR